MSVTKQVVAKPDWLNDVFVQNCVKNDVGASSIDDVVVQDVRVEYAVPKGENYCSVILRLIVNADVYDKNRNKGRDAVNGNTKHHNGSTNGVIDNSERRYIVKVPNEYKVMKEFADQLSMFPKEVDMYQNVVPNFQTILKRAGLDTEFACRCVHVYEEKKLFVMEDLCARNYILVDRINGTNLELTKLAYSKMARFHAASMKYFEQNSLKDIPEYYFKSMIRKFENEMDKAAIDPIFGPAVVSKKTLELAEDINKRPGYEMEAEILTKLSKHVFEMLCDIFKYEPDNKFNTLIHGDYWINNMLFKYNNEGKPIDVMLLDLQCAFFSNITLEFIYFFLSSTSDEVREHHYYDIVNFYYQNLIDTLNKVGYKGTKPTLQVIHESIIVSSPMFVFILSAMLTVLKNKFSEANDRSETEIIQIEDAMNLGSKTRENPIYVKTLFITVDLLRKIGAFEQLRKLLKVYDK